MLTDANRTVIIMPSSTVQCYKANKTMTGLRTHEQDMKVTHYERERKKERAREKCVSVCEIPV